MRSVSFFAGALMPLTLSACVAIGDLQGLLRSAEVRETLDRSDLEQGTLSVVMKVTSPRQLRYDAAEVRTVRVSLFPEGQVTPVREASAKLESGSDSVSLTFENLGTGRLFPKAEAFGAGETLLGSAMGEIVTILTGQSSRVFLTLQLDRNIIFPTPLPPLADSSATEAPSDPTKPSLEVSLDIVSGGSLRMPLAGHAEVLAGHPKSGWWDATGESARFSALGGLTIMPNGMIVVADTGNHSIRSVSPKGAVTTLAGNGSAGSVNGQGGSAQFNGPSDICSDSSGVLYVADSSNHMIRRIAPDGSVSTFAGAGVPGLANGKGANARFNSPSSIEIDSDGNLYVADELNHAIRMIDREGMVSTLAGNGIAGDVNGLGADARLSRPYSLTLEPGGNLWIMESFDSGVASYPRIRNLSRLGATSNTEVHFGKWDRPRLAIDKKGNFFGAVSNRIYLKMPEEPLRLFSPDYSGNLTFDSIGRLIGTAGNRVFVIR